MSDKLNHRRCFSMQGESTPEYSGDPIGGGMSKDAYTQADAAAICAQLGRKYYLAGRLRFLIDKTVALELEHYLWSEVAGMAHRDKWILSVGQETMRALAGLAIAECLYPVVYGQDAHRLLWFGKRIKLSPEKIQPAWVRCWRGRCEEAAGQPLLRWTDEAASQIYIRQKERGN